MGRWRARRNQQSPYAGNTSANGLPDVASSDSCAHLLFSLDVERRSMPRPTSSQHIFLDCNSALHYRRADQIDWCALADSAEVALVIAPVFLRELEQQKVVNGSKKLRHRADDAVRWLASRLDSGN